jgi:hypothetical protein
MRSGCVRKSVWSSFWIGMRSLRGSSSLELMGL